MITCISGYSINDIYPRLCDQIMQYGVDIYSGSTGTRERTNCLFTLYEPTQNLATCRNISLAYALGELTWYFTQRKDLEFISKFSSFWDHLSDDGSTVNSAYGYILHRKFGFDQIEMVIRLLKKDPLSRRAVVNINVPNPKTIITKDEPCTICLQFYVRRGRLCCTAIMRSNDLWFGLPYDVLYFTTLQQYVANALGFEVGPYVHFATSLHYYLRDTEKLLALDKAPKPIQFNALRFIEMVPYFENFTLAYSGSDLKKAIVDFAFEKGVLV